MKNLKTYHQLFENTQELTPEQIEWLDECSDNWTVNPQTGLVDVDGSFSCTGQDLTDFKGVRFGVVRAYFSCEDNRLTSLEGSPQEAEGFYCDDNQLTSLVGSPKRVGLDFFCNNNQLTSLEGAPQEIGSDFNCSNNQLTSLEGAPQKIGGMFKCVNNPVSEDTLRSIFYQMEDEMSYQEAVESLWSEIPLEDQMLLYKPEFEWVGPEEIKRLELIRAYHGFKGMI
jgi:hypothetical protein